MLFAHCDISISYQNVLREAARYYSTAMRRTIDISSLQTFTAVNLLSDPGELGGPLIIPQCAQITLGWTLTGGHTAHNVMYGRYSGGFHGTVAEANAILTALITGSGWTGLAAGLAPTTGLASVTIRDVNTANQALITSSAGGAGGAGTAPALPAEVALVATLRTALTGRANRGRIYIPGWASSAVIVGDLVSAGLVTALTTWASTIPAAFAGSGYTLVIGQRARAAYTGLTGTQHPARPAGSVPVTQLVCRDNHWDSQRKRGFK